MKKILVPTDFSPIAEHAIEYAIELGSKFNSELYLYHVYSLDRFNYDLNFPEDQQPFTRKAERNMTITKQKFKDAIAQKGLTIHTKVVRDSITSLFGRRVKKHGIDLIVMGSKGATGLEKVIFGSVAATAIEIAKVPVLVVPPGDAFRPFRKIVLAMDNQAVSPNVILPLQKLAYKFETKVILLNVNSDQSKKAYRKIDLSLDGIETNYYEVPMASSINESINEFIVNENCDLLCMVRREKDFFKSIFKKSITKTQVFRSQVPLLVLPENSKAIID